MKNKNNSIQFESTGRKQYVNGGILGISPSGFLYFGYDDEMGRPSSYNLEERQEIVTEMIRRLVKFIEEGDQGNSDRIGSNP